MGVARVTLYLVGLVLVIAAAWRSITATPPADPAPASGALAIILLLAGLGVMVGASALDAHPTRPRALRQAHEAPLRDVEKDETRRT